MPQLKTGLEVRSVRGIFYQVWTSFTIFTEGILSLEKWEFGTHQAHEDVRTRVPVAKVGVPDCSK